MRFVGLLVILLAFPAFIALLRSARYRRWAFVILGALPILYVPLNLDASLISWPIWSGHTRGLLLTALDPLALAICIHYAPIRKVPPLLWSFLTYILLLTPALFTGTFFTASLFFYFQVLRATVFFLAVYLAVSNGQLLRLAEGLALAVIASGAMSAYHSLSGATQAKGILGHQNLTGLATNLAIPLLLALALWKRNALFLAAIAAGAVGAIAGGSRATIAFYAIAVAATLFFAVMIKPNGRVIAIAAIGALGLVLASPFAWQKLSQRNVAGFELDGERIAFEQASREMIADHPFGVGLNHFVAIANSGGYFGRAGVRWQKEARATHVHNVWLLVRAEAGILGLLGLLVWVLVPAIRGLFLAFDRRCDLRVVSAACACSLLAAALHSRYEWILITATPHYLVSLMIGVIAAIAGSRSPSRRGREPSGKRPEIGRKSRDR